MLNVWWSFQLNLNPTINFPHSLSSMENVFVVNYLSCTRWCRHPVPYSIFLLSFYRYCYLLQIYRSICVYQFTCDFLLISSVDVHVRWRVWLTPESNGWSHRASNHHTIHLHLPIDLSARPIDRWHSGRRLFDISRMSKALLLRNAISTVIFFTLHKYYFITNTILEVITL